MNRSTKSIRVILADDHKLVRAGVCALMGTFPGVDVVGEASCGREALDLIKLHRPDVVLMDISMPGLNGFEAVTRITTECSEVRVIIFSMQNNEAYYWQALKAGAAGYLLKQAATSELETALQRVAHGELYLSREISKRLVGQFFLQGKADRQISFEQLTGREREILQLVAEGQNTQGIADILKISPKTVEYHRMKVMTDLNVHDIPGLVRFALRVGLTAQEG